MHRNRKTAILAGLSAVGVVLLALNQVGGTPITPGLRTGFNVDVLSGIPPTLRLTSNAGNLITWIELIISSEGDSTGAWTARMGTTPLSVRVERTRPRTWRVQIERPDTQSLAQFEWRSGVPIVLIGSGVADPSVTHWTLHTSGGRDTKGLARWRCVWFVILLAFTAVVLVWTFRRAFAGEKPAERRSLEEQAIAVVKELILAVEGSTQQDTDRFQEVLKAIVLDGEAPGSAVQRVLPKGTSARRFGLLRAATVKFTERLSKLQTRLDEFRVVANPPTEP